MKGFTKDTISEHTAKWWILLAVFAASFSGLVTMVAATKGLLGFTAWNWLDAALCFGLAYGVYRRNLVCAWILLVYYLASRLSMFLNAGAVPGFKVIFYTMVYSMAIVCIGLYPRPSPPPGGARNGPRSSEDSEDGARVV